MNEFTKFMTMKVAALLCLCTIAAACLNVSGQTVNVTVNGNWSLNVPMADLTEAGNNYTGSYASSTNQVLVSHRVIPPGQWRRHTWTVEVHMEDILWDNQLQLWIQRTGYGSGSWQQCTPSIHGGMSYQQVTSTPTYFYNGDCVYEDVPLQFELRNVSVLTPANNYSTEIVYTITVTR